jgi:cell wall-associated NlpC family hydrolase
MEKLATITILSTILFSNECIVNINLKAKDKSTTTINIKNKKECIINLKIDDLISVDAPINFDSNDTITNIISLAKSKLGSKYESTKAGPDSFDCSGFIYFIFSSNKIDIPRSSKEQSEMEGKQLTKDELEIGDLVFFDTSKKNHVNHSGLYIGDGNFIHSSSGKAYGVTISNLITGWYKDKFLWGIRKKI